MSSIKENHCYGLSSGKLCRGGNISLFHVKLTDSAARAIDAFHNSKSRLSHPTICFTGNQGRFTIPFKENRGEEKTFTFGLSNVVCDNPHGSFDCVQQLNTGADEEHLSCVGVIQKKMTVNATDDSYQKARQSIAQVEEETRSRGTIVIKHGDRFQSKKVTVRAPAPALANLAKPRHSSQSLLRRGASVSKVKKGACGSDKRSVSAVGRRPLRERVMHLLALRPYRRPDMVLRLQRDGLTAGDKDMLDMLLLEVGQSNSRDKTYILKDCLYKELQRDWPGYSTGDQQLLKRILLRRLFQPHQNLLTVPNIQVSPLRDTPNSSPARHHKHSLTEDYIDPLANKKPRISHLSGKTTNDKSTPKSSKQQDTARAKKLVTEVKEDNSRRNSLDPQKLMDSLSSVCKEQEDVAKRLEPAPTALGDAKGSALPSQPIFHHPPSPPKVPILDRHSRKRRKSKHKHRDQEVKAAGRERRKGDICSKDLKHKDHLDCADHSGMFYDSNVLQAANDMTDYLLKYTKLCSHDQRQRYKQDFNEEYSEYRNLHARIDSVTCQFMELDTQLKRLHHGSHQYKTIHNQILQEYRKIKKSNPNYNQEKIRCEYLHNKLAHIKKLISDYDQQQLCMDCP
ncbi:RNA polymerase II elongation factor ELL-like [Lampris incognitus]|uniref:RNA polymerase II elongation factor ELL-like n=1 Tax=Lampris incognitus TaxID=2546036 RepID=UPI0024B55ADF|nr:RNA polymerase II elongation factor ELL-like [Lampris incognitus]